MNITSRIGSQHFISLSDVAGTITMSRRDFALLGTLTLASFAVTGTGYSLRSTTCANLAVNGSCSVVVRFSAPAATGNYNGTLSVTAANGLPKTVTATLTASSK